MSESVTCVLGGGVAVWFSFKKDLLYLGLMACETLHVNILTDLGCSTYVSPPGTLQHHQGANEGCKGGRRDLRDPADLLPGCWQLGPYSPAGPVVGGGRCHHAALPHVSRGSNFPRAWQRKVMDSLIFN